MWESMTADMTYWREQGWRITPYHWVLPVPVDPPSPLTRLFNVEEQRILGIGRVELAAWPIPEDISWFLAPAWQDGEARVDEYIRMGRLQEYPSAKDFINHLHSLVAEREHREHSVDRAI